MDGYDIQKYELLKNRAKSAGMVLGVKGSAIELTYKKDYIGKFESGETAFAFVCGFEYGKSKGKYEKIR